MGTWIGPVVASMGKRKQDLEIPERGSPPPVEEIYRRHFHRIFAFAYGRLEDRDDGLEVTQEVFFRFLKGGRSPSLPEDEVIRYLYGIARNVVADHLAGRFTWKTVGLEEEVRLPEHLKEPGIDALLVEQCLARLNDTDRTILARYFCRGDTHREIASSLGMTQGSVRQRFHRALAGLRKWLSEADL